ncbi:MAG: ABC transporter permease [Elusimicrobiota bacterium]
MERFKEALATAFFNLINNPIRSFLSVLGVVIGIAAVISVLAVGAGARKKIMDNMDNQSVLTFFLYTKYDEATSRMGKIEPSDIEKIKQVPLVISVLPNINLYREIRSREKLNYVTIKGIDEEYLKSKKFQILYGRNISPIEMEHRSPVCLMSEAATHLFFPEENTLSQNIFFNENAFQVIGSYKRSATKKSNSEDLEILVPYTLLLRMSQDVSIQNLEITMKPEAGLEAKDSLLDAMSRGEKDLKNLFSIRDEKEIYERSLSIRKTMSMVGVFVAGISLLVGGIGMMNVMLTSVAERTREIGLRRAVGARKKDILIQFLVESCVLSSLGAGLGLLLGSALTKGLPVMIKSLESAAPKIEVSYLWLAGICGMIMGIVFGLYPAIKASKLSPAEALRSE